MVERLLIDISQPVDASTGYWPGDTPFSHEWTWAMQRGDSCNGSRVITSPHVGSHADAPLHFLPDGRSIGEVDLHRYVGLCWVVDGPHEGLVWPEHFAGIDVRRHPRLLVRTRDQNSETFPTKFVSLAPETARWLREHAVLLIGLDSPSMDDLESKDLPAHHALLPSEIAILENLWLAEVKPGPYELIALPLRWMGVDASPVRAVLRTLD